MKVKTIKDSTTNRGEFNRAYKAHLERKNKIRCSYCKYHRNENRTTNLYWGDDSHLKYPNWKLVSKNEKQWMEKPMMIKMNRRVRFDAIIETYEFIFTFPA